MTQRYGKWPLTGALSDLNAAVTPSRSSSSSPSSSSASSSSPSTPKGPVMWFSSWKGGATVRTSLQKGGPESYRPQDAGAIGWHPDRAGGGVCGCHPFPPPHYKWLSLTATTNSFQTLTHFNRTTSAFIIRHVSITFSPDLWSFDIVLPAISIQYVAHRSNQQQKKWNK